MAAGYEIPLDLKINFLENVVIPSFSPRLPHAGDEEARFLWIRNKAGTHYGEFLEDFMFLVDDLGTKVEAKQELKNLKQERKEQDRREERQLQLLQHQTSKSIFDIYFSIHFYLTPSIVSPLHPFSRYQFPAQHAFT
jgi:hypothetical protein